VSCQIAVVKSSRGGGESSVKIFHVIYVLGKVTAVSLVGGLNEGSQALCDKMDVSSAQFLDEQFQKVAVDDRHMQLAGRPLTRADFSTKCVTSEQAPIVEKSLAAEPIEK
jgi:hypothetical protein